MCKAGREDHTFTVDFYNPLCYQLVLPRKGYSTFLEKKVEPKTFGLKPGFLFGYFSFSRKTSNELKRINYYVNRQTDRRIN